MRNPTRAEALPVWRMQRDAELAAQRAALALQELLELCDGLPGIRLRLTVDKCDWIDGDGHPIPNAVEQPGEEPK